MANVIEILIQAKNTASAEIDKATGGMSKFAGAAGLGAAAGTMAGMAIVTAMQSAQQAIIGTTTAFADEVEQLDRMSLSTRLTVTQLQVFRMELEKGGLSADQFGISMRFFQNAIASGEMEKLGITSRDTFTALQQLSVAFGGTADAAARVELLSKSLGVRNVELGASVLETATNYRTHLNDALEAGAILSDTQAEKFRKLDESLDNFSVTVRAFKIATSDMFAPIIKGAADALTSINKLAVAFRTIEEKDVARMKALSDRMTPGNMASAHTPVKVESEYDQWVRYFAPKPGGGSGGGGGRGGISDPLIAKMDELVKAFSSLSPSSSAAGRLRSAMGDGGMAADTGKDVVDPIVKAFSRVQEYAQQFGYNFEGSLRGMFSQALSITSTSNNLIVMGFTSLANAVSATIAEMMARAAAAGLVKLALSFIPGAGAAGIDAKIGSVFGTSASPLAGGGNTYIMQSINQGDAMANLMNPSGSLRRAGDRMRDLSIANAG